MLKGAKSLKIGISCYVFIYIANNKYMQDRLSRAMSLVL